MSNVEIFKDEVVWVNFFAKTKNANYISGHDETGKEFVLSSTGKLFRHVEYTSGYLLLKEEGVQEQIIQLYEIDAINNEDTSKPAPSANIKQCLAIFNEM